MCTRTRTHICTHTRTHTHTYTHTCAHARTHAHTPPPSTHTHTRTHAHAHTQTHTHTHTHTCTRSFTTTCTRTRTYAHTHLHDTIHINTGALCVVACNVARGPDTHLLSSLLCFWLSVKAQQLFGCTLPSLMILTCKRSEMRTHTKSGQMVAGAAGVCGVKQAVGQTCRLLMWFCLTGACVYVCMKMNIVYA